MALRHYVVLSADTATYTPNMIASLGHPNIFIRMSIDETQGLMEFDTPNTPAPYAGQGMTDQVTRNLMQTSAWTETNAVVLTGATKYIQARAYGSDLINEILTGIEDKYPDTINFTERRAWVANVNFRQAMQAMLAGDLYVAELEFDGMTNKAWFTTAEQLYYRDKIQIFLNSIGA